MQKKAIFACTPFVCIFAFFEVENAKKIHEKIGDFFVNNKDQKSRKLQKVSLIRSYDMPHIADKILCVCTFAGKFLRK